MTLPDNLSFDTAVDLFRRGRAAESKQVCQALLRQDPRHADALHLLGVIAYYEGMTPVSLALIGKAIKERPLAPDFHLNLALSLVAANKSAAAHEAVERALELAPSLAAAHAMRGYVLLRQGNTAEAVEAYRRALRVGASDPNTHSSLLLALQYLPHTDGADMLREARLWNQLHGPAAGFIPAYANARHPGRRLRVGYVSADFRHHSVGYLLDGILGAHDRAAVEIFCYSNHWLADELTERMQAASDRWRSIVGVSDSAAAALIRHDQIDILVDLTGHTAGNRLPLFSLRPAPVQVTWLGYSGTTGSDAIDYILLDAEVCPEGQESAYSERVIRLPGCYLAWSPPASAPVCKRPPAADNGHVTFGCFNNPTKITAEMTGVWSRILEAVPGSRLYLKAAVFDDPSVRDHYTRMCLAAGIPAERLTVVGKTSQSEVLQHYRNIDIALDPFPYNGCVTTLEALWMNVPVVSQRGDYFASRMGQSLLSTVGLGALASASADAYVRTAAQLGSDLERLVGARAGLRERVAASVLTDGSRLAAELEQAYRDMWSCWCESTPTAAER